MEAETPGLWPPVVAGIDSFVRNCKVLGKIEAGGEGDDRMRLIGYHQLDGHELGKLKELMMDEDMVLQPIELQRVDTTRQLS